MVTNEGTLFPNNMYCIHVSPTANICTGIHVRIYMYVAGNQLSVVILGYAKLMSEETLGSDGSSDGEGGGGGGRGDGRVCTGKQQTKEQPHKSKAGGDIE